MRISQLKAQKFNNSEFVFLAQQTTLILTNTVSIVKCYLM